MQVQGSLQITTPYRADEVIIPHQILNYYHQLSNKNESSLSWKFSDEKDIWLELCFCVLSANVNYELAKSATEVLNYDGFLDARWIINDFLAEDKIQSELGKQRFLPRIRNGGLRKYRYPKKRAKQLVKAAKVIYANDITLKRILNGFSSAEEARTYFFNMIPGLGIKEASHFLRNIGFSNSLAIIDIHILSFLRNYSLIDFDKKISVTPSVYLILERILKNLANLHGLNLAVLDLAIWHYMRRNML